MALFLVRHGRPIMDPDRPAAAWTLDPSGLEDIALLRPRLPRQARWCTSPEPKAVDTARLLAPAPGRVEVIEDLREIARPTHAGADDFAVLVERTFAEPDLPAAEGWESAASCRRRIEAAVRPLLPGSWRDHLVLVGHGTAFTLLVAALTATRPDVRRWRALAMPDVIRLDLRAIAADS